MRGCDCLSVCRETLSRHVRPFRHQSEDCRTIKSCRKWEPQSTCYNWSSLPLSRGVIYSNLNSIDLSDMICPNPANPEISDQWFVFLLLLHQFLLLIYASGVVTMVPKLWHIASWLLIQFLQPSLPLIEKLFESKTLFCILLQHCLLYTYYRCVFL